MEKWEYCFRNVYPFSDTAVAEINDLGLQGWEAVNFTVWPNGYMAMFKRRIL